MMGETDVHANSLKVTTAMAAFLTAPQLPRNPRKPRGTGT